MYVVQGGFTYYVSYWLGDTPAQILDYRLLIFCRAHGTGGVTDSRTMSTPPGTPNLVHICIQAGGPWKRKSTSNHPNNQINAF